MNTTRRATKGRVPKAPVALLVVAAVLTLGRVATGGQPGQGIPDPEEIALRASERSSAAEIVELWEDKVAEFPATGQFRARLASAQMSLAGETGDLALYEVAEVEAAEAVRLGPDDVTARLTHAATLSGQHDFAGALVIIDSALAEDPTSIAALLASGDANLELGRYEEADALYGEARLRLAGSPPALTSRFAHLESIRGNTPTAATLSREALIASGSIDLSAADAAFYWLQLAHYEALTGNLDEAEAMIRDSLVVDPDNLGATEQLAQVLAAQGDDDGAIAVYRDLITRSPAADLHGELAKVYTRAGRPAEAATEIDAGLRQAAEVADRFPAERRHLIGFLADHDPPAALRLATLDLETRQDVYSHAWYAWSLHRTGDEKAARRALVPVLAQGTDDPWVLYQAGSIEAANGRSAAAIQLLERALDINPVFDVVHAPRAQLLLATLTAVQP